MLAAAGSPLRVSCNPKRRTSRVTTRIAGESVPCLLEDVLDPWLVGTEAGAVDRLGAGEELSEDGSSGAVSSSVPTFFRRWSSENMMGVRFVAGSRCEGKESNFLDFSLTCTPLTKISVATFPPSKLDSALL